MDSEHIYHSLGVSAARLFTSLITLKRRIRKGEIEARRILVSGCCYRFVISEKEICRYIEQNWPTMADLELPPKSPRAARIKQIRDTSRRHLKKALAANAARRFGNLR